MPTIEPMTVMPPSTVSKIGTSTLVVRRQRDEDERAATAKRAVGLPNAFGAAASAIADVGAAELPGSPQPDPPSQR